MAGPELLLERDGELDSLRSALREAADGGGRFALIEGPAGIGKTRLLAELRSAAQEDELRVLSARGSELEREFPFGVVRQLFEPPLAASEARERWLAGAAAPARAIFEVGEPESNGAATDATFAALHGLYWLTANVAADGPVMLSVDDLHWCDRPSLRFLAYLVRRLEDMPALVGATLRSTDPGTDPALIAEIGHDPATRSIRPGPLSAAAVSELVRARLGDDAHERFSAACARVTGGNPLLLRQLLTSLEADGVKPDAAHVDVVADIGPRAVSRTVLLRLARLSDEAVRVARSAAILGEHADLPAVAALAELGQEEAAAASATLAHAEILRAEPPIGFVHPLVRDAVYQELSSAQRELMHSRAAAELRAAGAPADQVASHLLSMPRRGQEWVVDVLMEAARTAARRSAPDSTRRLPHPRASGAARRRAARRDPAGARHRGNEHLRAARPRAPARGLRAARGSAPPWPGRLPPRTHADLRRRRRRRRPVRPPRPGRPAAGARGRAQRARGGRAHGDLLRRHGRGRPRPPPSPPRPRVRRRPRREDARGRDRLLLHVRRRPARPRRSSSRSRRWRAARCSRATTACSGWPRCSRSRSPTARRWARSGRRRSRRRTGTARSSRSSRSASGTAPSSSPRASWPRPRSCSRPTWPKPRSTGSGSRRR